MSGLIGNLLNASKALGAHQQGIQIAGQNLANVNNPNYARQRVILGDKAVVDSPIGPVSTGVEALSVQQIRDQFLDAIVVREQSASSLLDSQQSALSRAQSALGEQVDRSADSAFAGSASQSTNGIGSALNGFFNDFVSLAASPSDAGAKQVLLQQATLLADKINVTDTRLTTLQTDLTTNLNNGVANVNSLLQEIGNLNGSIASQELGVTGVAVTLRDQRQAKLEELSTYLNFTSPTIASGNGQIQIIVKDASGADVILLDRTQVKGGISFNGTGFDGGAPAVALGLVSGSLTGDLSMRDGAVQTLRNNLKSVADQLGAGVNTAYAGSFFQVPPSAGLIAVDPALTLSTLKTTATTDAGANDIALAVAGVAQQKFSTAGGDAIDGSIGSYYNKVVTSLGQSLYGVSAKLEDQTIIKKMSTTQRDAISSVSLDEEMTDLIKFQRAYQASAKVISVMDSLLDTVVNGLIR